MSYDSVMLSLILLPVVIIIAVFISIFIDDVKDKKKKPAYQPLRGKQMNRPWEPDVATRRERMNSHVRSISDNRSSTSDTVTYVPPYFDSCSSSYDSSSSCDSSCGCD